MLLSMVIEYLISYHSLGWHLFTDIYTRGGRKDRKIDRKGAKPGWDQRPREED